MALAASHLPERQTLNITENVTGDFSALSLETAGRKYTTEELDALFPADRFYQRLSAFYYKERARLYFTVAEEFAPLFILIKGITEFSRPKELKFTFDPEKKLFEIDLFVDQFSALSQLLTLVDVQLRKEIRFKAALKKIILFENRYRLEAAEVYKLQAPAL